MPIYEYSCNNCGHKFEKKNYMVYRNEYQECPKCGGQLSLAVSANSRRSESWVANVPKPVSTKKKR
jgi:putative FmdB family regulatory protein